MRIPGLNIGLLRNCCAEIIEAFGTAEISEDTFDRGKTDFVITSKLVLPPELESYKTQINTVFTQMINQGFLSDTLVKTNLWQRLISKQATAYRRNDHLSFGLLSDPQEFHHTAMLRCRKEAGGYRSAREMQQYFFDNRKELIRSLYLVIDSLYTHHIDKDSQNPYQSI